MLANADILEVIWTISSLVGFIACAAGLRQALEDKHNLKISGINGVNELLIDSDLRREVLRIPICAVLLLAGIAALLAPNIERSLTGIIVTLMVIATQILFVLNSVLDRVLRRKLDGALLEKR